MMRTMLAVMVLGFASAPVFAQLDGGLGQGGIYVDPEGVLRATGRPSRGKIQKPVIPEDVASASQLRRVSLKALDQQIRKAGGEIPDDVWLLAGITKVQYLIFDREREDIWLAGPAEGWQIDAEGRHVGIDSGCPTLHLDDLAAALRCVLQGQGYAECSIDPQREGLAAIQRYELPAPTNRREAMPHVKEIEELYGLQTVRTSGVPEGSRFARVMIEADYRMKRMAMEAERVANLPSHLDVLASMVEQGISRQDVLARWWFAPFYTAIISNDDATVFQLQGQGVRLLNEAVFLDRTGARAGSGSASPEWDRFSKTFTDRFPAIEEKLPVFADLHNLFDLMMVAALIRSQNVGGWLRESALLDEGVLPLPLATQPTFAEPVVNFKLHSKSQGRQRIVYSTYAWGGVAMDPRSVIAPELVKTEPTEKLVQIERVFADIADPETVWWQDGKVESP